MNAAPVVRFVQAQGWSAWQPLWLHHRDLA
jgi:hypothetical protein